MNKIKIGDYVVANESCGNETTKGKSYKVLGIGVDNSIFFKGDDGLYHHYHVGFFKKVSNIKILRQIKNLILSMNID